ncbi:glycogen synthase [Nanoarchaeota archaeon]
MDIAFITRYSLLHYGGGEKWLINIGNKLKEKGYKIIIFSGGSLPYKLIETDNLYKLIEFKYYEILIPKVEFKAFSEHFINLKYFDYDIIYLQNLWDSSFFSFISKNKDQKLIIGSHGVFFNSKTEKIKKPIFEPLAKIYFHKIKNVKIHVLNSEQYKWYKSLGFKEIYLIPNFVNSKEYLYPENNDEFIVLFLARIERQKGIDLLINIIEKVLNKNKDIKFYIAGSGRKYYENILRKLENKYPDNVKYFGFVDENTKRELLSKSSLFLLPSRFEGQPIGVLESLVSGTPFLGSNIVSFRDLINIYDKKFGWIVNNYDSDSFANKILEIYNYWKNNKDEYFELRKYISKRARELFDIDKVVDKFEKVFLNRS